MLWLLITHFEQLTLLPKVSRWLIVNLKLKADSCYLTFDTEVVILKTSTEPFTNESQLHFNEKFQEIFRSNLMKFAAKLLPIRINAS